MQRVPIISVFVIAVSKLHELLLKVRRLSSTLLATTPTPSRGRVVISSSTTQGFDFEDESMFFPRRRTLVPGTVLEIIRMYLQTGIQR